jgi:hypothetical protein
MINAFSAASVRESRLTDFVGFYWPDRCSCRRGGFRVREEDKGKIWRRPSPLRAIVCSSRSDLSLVRCAAAVRGPLWFGLRFG